MYTSETQVMISFQVLLHSSPDRIDYFMGIRIVVPTIYDIQCQDIQNNLSY